MKPIPAYVNGRKRMLFYDAVVIYLPTSSKSITAPARACAAGGCGQLIPIEPVDEY